MGMKELHISIACISLLILLTGLINRKLERSIISEPLLGLLLGIMLGPEVLKLLDLESWGKKEEIMAVACRFTMAMALVATALRLPKHYVEENKNTQSVLVLFGMITMWMASSVLLYFIFGISFTMALLIGAIITPTDPVVASTMVSGKTSTQLIPSRIRYGISFESGINDGLAFPFVLLPMLLITKPDKALEEWVVKGLLWETGVAVSLGITIGYVGGKLLHYAHQHKYTSEKSLLSLSIALAFFTIGLLELIKVNSIIGVFLCGLFLNKAISRNEDLEEEKVQEMMERIFVIPVFVLFGLILPWDKWWEMGWKALAIIGSVTLFRRLPWIMLLKPLLPRFNKKEDVAVIGWYGPIGVAALYYAAHVLKETQLEDVWNVTTLIISSSIVVYAVTSYPAAKLYARRTGFHKEVTDKQ